MGEEMMVHKVTLSTGKVVLIRPLEIGDEEKAAQLAESRVGSDKTASLAIAMQQELMKLLIVQIDGKSPEKSRLENLNNVFSYDEYRQMRDVIQKLMGADSGNPMTELVSFGEQ